MKSATIIKLEEQMEESSLSIIDKILISAKNIKFEKDAEWQLIKKLCEYIIKYLKIEMEGDNYIDEVFSDSIGFVNQEFIALCFLRLLNYNTKIIENYKLKIINLFDKSLKDVYRVRNISEKELNFEKVNKLHEYIPSIERQLSSTLNDIDTLKEFNHQRFRSTLNKNDYKKVIKHFLPRDYDREIDNIFKKNKNL